MSPAPIAITAAAMTGRRDRRGFRARWGTGTCGGTPFYRTRKQVMARDAGCRGKASRRVVRLEGNDWTDQTASHTPSVGLSSSQAEPRRYQEDVTEMRHQEPLRISCDGCPGGCDNCLVEFFTAEREAQVVRLGGEDAADAKAASTAATQRPLDPDLDRALATLIAAGLHPELLAVRPNQRRVSRAS